MKLGIYTLGCRLNSLESEAIAEHFTKMGWSVENRLSDDDDLIIINTCTVTSSADSTARRLIRKYGNSIKTIVTGCYVNVSSENEIESLASLVEVVKDKSTLLSYFSEDNRDVNSLSSCTLANDTKGEMKDPFAFNPLSFAFHSRASLKIQEGCNNSCSFCLTHIARGKALSLQPELVLDRIKALESRGFHEICLTGVNLASYYYNGTNLTRLLKLILPHLSDSTRLRFSSLEPDFLDAEFFEVIKDHHIFPFFHLPIQSVDNEVIKLTGRHYTEADLDRIVEGLKNAKANPYIAADIIAGLPGEDEKAFNTTYNFLKKHEFSRLHVFPFSPRKGTAAASEKHPPERIRDERAKLLGDLSKNLYQNYIKSNNNKTLEAIAEKNDGEATIVTTENYIKTEVKGAVITEGELIKGTLRVLSPLKTEFIVQK